MTASAPSRIRAWPWRSIVTDLGVVVGFGCIGYGAWLIYPPSAFFVAGIFLVTLSILGAPSRSA